ncbi:DNA-directed RNA polymerase subunit alpha [Candidatus Curtissbacteria bacterium RIFCSPHIGHO2_01_FULL_41_44]|uniref:DNA-directed RNA polymerase subunit alpha n=1 Tax=Candidatus Curtissbacteria bacterium RIFCSPLOWO2_01_FULL_42_50 TaxID=1797730 RepID=A0A1F5H2B9_9BACT|nr:MAG: DNA-directed RNA polymerase subunit alpha [Candidatus Curtissbacteria bacterium RIFCSPHIGHO2_02_FULL_42_58]OGD94750.1 MAG: DNA-directed RNA polymerase subunit alpha [Candidatus Curtissbacteria bacterium RIFCSPHIGHO2_01_FULL_41_44]OGD96293.1 MAG: DNA-directed RNA polymerase subunit alpha [Candidatus Curtissbacteria bacterium RIFCSPHIGHO2_12_FULL_42_33]OGD98312.1 MAG: DNA-directed RNA polymerase subunit alpha [Candidatus Curtissbacteria bacterium RIFCSPLOWO2_01_FULL_42_50]OGE02949.1 MAG: 
MLDLSQIEIETEKETQEFGKFIIEPLDQGYGHTIGNSLRRVLLTSLPSAAITQVKISGIRHQFSSLPGMTEDIVEFILNLKNVRLKIAGDKPVRLTLDVKGPKEVKAKDIEPAAGVEIVNGDLILAHLADSKTRLNARLVAETGMGYSLAEERKTDEIGIIPIDANFSPIISVNYKVEATRVGRLTNYDKLIIEIATDGTIKPSLALKQAAKILVDHFITIYQPQTGSKKQKPQTSQPPSDEVLKTSLEELDLPVRLTNSLKSSKVETIGDFLQKDKKDLLKMKNLGPKSIALVEEKLSEKGVDVK